MDQLDGANWIVAVLESADLVENMDGKHMRESCLVIAVKS